jgi:myo-inositol-1(or 4)-monophosphatase
MSVELLEIARRIALEAGALAAQRRREGVSVAASKSSDVDVVTAADRETEALIRALIAAERPDDAFYGEESDAVAGSSGLVWVVDPIDGTVNYLYGNPAWAVSIAVGELDPDAADDAEPTARWRALAGVVYAPDSAELYTASAGGGAFLERIDREPATAERLRVNADPTLGHALIGTGFSYIAERRSAQAAVLGGLLPRVRDIRRGGSAALDLCAVASGRLDGYYERHINPWDHAAGALIAGEAGARVAGLHGAPATAQLLIAAAPGLFAELHAALVQAGIGPSA